MDRNDNYDYRSFFYPGRALPVKIFPVSGHPRFPFNMGTTSTHSTSANAVENIILTAYCEPSAANTTTSMKDYPSRHRETQSPAARSKSRVAKPLDAPAPRLDHVIQRLSHELSEAITFWESCLARHLQVVGLASYAGHGTRGSLWQELLDAEFDADGVRRDLLHTLAPRARQHTQQALRAARERPLSRSAVPSDMDSYDKLVLDAERLAAEGDWIGRLEEKAMRGAGACEDMLDCMRRMKVLCDLIKPDPKIAGQEDEEAGDEQDNENACDEQ